MSALTSAESGTLKAAEVGCGSEGVSASTTDGVLSVTEQTIITSMPGFDAEIDKVLFECYGGDGRIAGHVTKNRDNNGWDCGK